MRIPFARTVMNIASRLNPKTVAAEVIDTGIAKVAQGATEVSNALFTGHGYSPYTADNTHRAQFQNKDQSRGMER